MSENSKMQIVDSTPVTPPEISEPPSSTVSEQPTPESGARAADGSPAAALPNGDSMTGSLQSLIEGIHLLTDKFEEHSTFVRSKFSEADRLQKAYDDLYQDLADYKEKFLYGLQRSLLNDLLLLYDTVEKQIEYLEGDGREKLDFVRSELLEILRRQDIEPIVYEGRKVDRTLHRVIKTEATHVAEQDHFIVKTVRRGFMRRDKVFRPEEVVAWRFEPAAASE